MRRILRQSPGVAEAPDKRPALVQNQGFIAKEARDFSA
jgi:hypothetical protein